MASVIVPVGPNDTPESLAIRYTIGGAAYAPAITQANTWLDAETYDPVGDRTLLSPMGITGAAIPSEWLRAGAQGVAAYTPREASSGLNASVLGVPAWVWLAGAILLVAIK